jgi:hypothetical protein
VGNRRVCGIKGKVKMARGEIDILAPIFAIDSLTWLQPQRNLPRGGVNMAVALPVFYSSDFNAQSWEFFKECHSLFAYCK